MGIALPGTEPVGRRAEVRLRDDVPAILVAVDASAAGKADKCRRRMHFCWLHGMLVAEVAMRLLKLLLVLLVSAAGSALAGPFEDGEAAFNKGDYEAALRSWRPLAEQGDAEAQTSIGVMYENGIGVQQDYQQAVFWYRQAADQGYAVAQYNLGVVYGDGSGVQQDYQQAASWYRKAAEQGYAGAQHNLGIMYAKGHGVPQDYAAALSLWTPLAAQGNARAQFFLGYMYETGRGVPQDYKEAVRLYGLATTQYLAASEEAMKRIREKGFARGENSQLIEFRNWQEAERNAVFYSTATRAAGTEEGALSVPTSAASINALNAAITGAQSDVTAAVRDYGGGSQQARDARGRLADLNAKKARIVQGRAFGGRTGYATDGGVDDEEPPVQLAQAYPKGTPLPAPPSIPRTAPPIAPPGGPTTTTTPTPKGAGSSEPGVPQPRADHAPKTMQDYHRLINEYGTSVDAATLAEWQAQRRYLMDQALEKQRVVDPSSGTVSPVPSAASAAQQVDFAQDKANQCTRTESVYREGLARLLELHSSIWEEQSYAREQSKRASPFRTVDRLLTMKSQEITGIQLALQFMQMAGCPAPSPPPNFHRGDRVAVQCAFYKSDAKAADPKVFDVECPELRAEMDAIRAGK